jgi:hypothetical protein
MAGDTNECRGRSHNYRPAMGLVNVPIFRSCSNVSLSDRFEFDVFSVQSLFT